MNWLLLLLGFHLACAAVFAYLCFTAPVMPAWMDA